MRKLEQPSFAWPVCGNALLGPISYDGPFSLPVAQSPGGKAPRSFDSWQPEDTMLRRQQQSQFRLMSQEEFQSEQDGDREDHSEGTWPARTGDREREEAVPLAAKYPPAPDRRFDPPKLSGCLEAAAKEGADCERGREPRREERPCPTSRLLWRSRVQWVKRRGKEERAAAPEGWKAREAELVGSTIPPASLPERGKMSWFIRIESAS